MMIALKYIFSILLLVHSVAVVLLEGGQKALNREISSRDEEDFDTANDVPRNLKDGVQIKLGRTIYHTAWSTEDSESIEEKEKKYERIKKYINDANSWSLSNLLNLIFKYVNKFKKGSIYPVTEKNYNESISKDKKTNANNETYFKLFMKWLTKNKFLVSFMKQNNNNYNHDEGKLKSRKHGKDELKSSAKFINSRKNNKKSEENKSEITRLKYDDLSSNENTESLSSESSVQINSNSEEVLNKHQNRKSVEEIYPVTQKLTYFDSGLINFHPTPQEIISNPQTKKESNIKGESLINIDTLFDSSIQLPTHNQNEQIMQITKLNSLQNKYALSSSYDTPVSGSSPHSQEKSTSNEIKDNSLGIEIVNSKTPESISSSKPQIKKPTEEKSKIFQVPQNNLLISIAATQIINETTGKETTTSISVDNSILPETLTLKNSPAQLLEKQNMKKTLNDFQIRHSSLKMPEISSSKLNGKFIPKDHHNQVQDLESEQIILMSKSTPTSKPRLVNSKLVKALLKDSIKQIENEYIPNKPSNSLITVSRDPLPRLEDENILKENLNDLHLIKKFPSVSLPESNLSSKPKYEHTLKEITNNLLKNDSDSPNDIGLLYQPQNIRNLKENSQNLGKTLTVTPVSYTLPKNIPNQNQNVSLKVRSVPVAIATILDSSSKPQNLKKNSKDSTMIENINKPGVLIPENSLLPQKITNANITNKIKPTSSNKDTISLYQDKFGPHNILIKDQDSVIISNENINRYKITSVETKSTVFNDRESDYQFEQSESDSFASSEETNQDNTRVDTVNIPDGETMFTSVKLERKNSSEKLKLKHETKLTEHLSSISPSAEDFNNGEIKVHASESGNQQENYDTFLQYIYKHSNSSYFQSLQNKSHTAIETDSS